MTAGLLDAVQDLVVIIRDADRKGAVQCSPAHCVVANALRRLRWVQDARVGQGTARIQRGGVWYRYELDASTKAAIRAYDKAKEHLPPGFRAVLVPPREPVGARAGERPGSNRRSGKRQSVATRHPSTRSIFVEPPARKART